MFPRPAYRRVTAALSWTLSIVLMASCGLVGDDDPDDTEVTWPEQAKIAKEVPKDLHEIAPTSGCPSAPRLVATEKAPENGIVATVERYWAGGFQDNVVLSAEALAKIPEALSTDQYLDMSWAYQNGAFSAGGGVAYVNLFNMAESAITITDIHPVNVVRECVPLAALILYLAEGGDPVKLHFDMDAESPAPRDSETGELYFEDNPPIEVPPLKTQQVQMTFDTLWGAYTFEMAVEYELDGSRYTALLDNQGVPFRIATMLCGSRDDLAGLPEESAQRLKTLRFEEIRERGSAGIEKQDPEDHAAGCFR